MNWKPTTTVIDALAADRKSRTPDIEVALQDFLELPDQEKQELLFSVACSTEKRLAWCMGVLTELVQKLGRP